MTTVAVDSNVLIAARIAADRNHEPGSPIATGIDTGELPTARVTDDVLAEVLNYLHSKAGDDAAMETFDALLSATDFELGRTTKTDFDAVPDVTRLSSPVNPYA